MNEYQAYYVVNQEGVVAGPFPSADAAISAKIKLENDSILSVVKSIIQAEFV